MTIKNKDVMENILKSIKQLASTDEETHLILMQLYAEVFKECNSGVKRNIANMLFEWIDAEAQRSHIAK